MGPSRFGRRWSVLSVAWLAACGSTTDEPSGVCEPEETQFCTCVVDAGRILGEETCGADRAWGECICTIEPDGGVTPPGPDAGFRHDAGPPDAGLPLLCSPYGTRSQEDCNIVGVGLGTSHTCVQRAWGEVDCFGDDSLGQLGRGMTPAPDPGVRWSPQDVIAVDELSVTAIDAAGDYTCALDAEGAVWCFGDNSTDQLGSGMDHETLASSSVPLEVMGLDPVSRLSMSPAHACVLGRDNGAVYCWGSNATQQLGRGAPPMALPSSPSPDKVTGVENARGVAAGGGFTCLFDTDGLVKCVGRNTNGELGHGMPAVMESGTLVDVMLPMGSRALALAAGSDHACAILDDRTVWCWGSNLAGQLGIEGTTMMSAVPIQLLFPKGGSAIEDARAISAGASHTCILNGSRTVVCWGDHVALCDPFGDMKPVRARSMFWYGANARDVRAGSGHTCAITSDQGLHCIGANQAGQSFPGEPGAQCEHDLAVDILN